MPILLQPPHVEGWLIFEGFHRENFCQKLKEKSSLVSHGEFGSEDNSHAVCKIALF